MSLYRQVLLCVQHPILKCLILVVVLNQSQKKKQRCFNLKAFLVTCSFACCETSTMKSVFLSNSFFGFELSLRGSDKFNCIIWRVVFFFPLITMEIIKKLIFIGKQPLEKYLTHKWHQNYVKPMNGLMI